MAYLPTVRSFVDICGVSRTSIHLPGGMTPAMGYPDFQLPRTDASGHFHRSGVAMTNVSQRKWTILDVNTCSVPPPPKKNIEIFWFQEPSFVGRNAFWKMVNPLRMTMATIPNWIYIYTGIYGGFFKWRYPQMVCL